MDNEYQRALGRVEGKLDLVIDQVTALRGSFETLEAGRLSRLETTVAQQTVRLTMIAAGIPLAMQVGLFVVQHYWR